MGNKKRKNKYGRAADMYKSVDHRIDAEQGAGKLKENPNLKIIDSIKTLSSADGFTKKTKGRAEKTINHDHSNSQSRSESDLSFSKRRGS